MKQHKLFIKNKQIHLYNVARVVPDEKFKGWWLVFLGSLEMSDVAGDLGNVKEGFIGSIARVGLF
jgi:hypothetical protein